MQQRQACHDDNNQDSSVKSTVVSAEMTNKMANTEEADEELYENLKRDPKLHRYDEITINFGKPVILANPHNNSSVVNNLGSESAVVDLFHSISFTSPIED